QPSPLSTQHPALSTAFPTRPGSSSPRILLSVGRLIRRKGLLEFVEHVMPALVKDHPDVLLLIVGDDAKVSLVHPERLRERIQAKVAELHLENHVRLLGTVPDAELNALFHQAHLFVLPALDIPGDIEGFGIVLLEAALAGVPAVATRVGGIPEAVQDNITGLLTPPADYPALHQAISRLLSDNALYQSLSSAAAHRARTDFSWDAILPQYEQSLRKCLSSV
ncbi:MAG: glycosyltransferase family 4 protein, partial [Bacillota bacterium]